MSVPEVAGDVEDLGIGDRTRMETEEPEVFPEDPGGRETRVFTDPVVRSPRKPLHPYGTGTEPLFSSQETTDPLLAALPLLVPPLIVLLQVLDRDFVLCLEECPFVSHWSSSTLTVTLSFLVELSVASEYDLRAVSGFPFGGSVVPRRSTFSPSILGLLSKSP